jgi:hypothetical protein
MINLWYDESYWSHRNGVVSGPQKVVNNLISSLNQENIIFSINEGKYENNFLLQYNELGYKKHEFLEHNSCFIGPQFWGWDQYGRFLFDNPQYYNQLIAPSKWVKDQLISNQFNLPENKVSTWPVGIELLQQQKNYKFDCLIYFKRRDENELTKIINFLDNKNISYKVLSYGNYESSDLEMLSNRSKFCFLLNGTESQGIAVQEIMSTNTPLLVWDVVEWNDMGEKYKTPATSIPYWSDLCGEVFYDYSDLEFTFTKFYDKINYYNPRKFVENNLSFKASVKTLLEILKKNK